MLCVVMNPIVHAVNGGERPMHAVNGDEWRWRAGSGDEQSWYAVSGDDGHCEWRCAIISRCECEWY